MTFDELVKQLAHDYLNPPEKHDGTRECDRNGHTRLTVLQEKYGLSSLKVQKLLVTAGVYEPVKASSNYYAVKRLRHQGKSIAEIMDATGLSSAAITAFLPYERNVYNAEELGVDISSDAARKRKQRNKEEERMENARNVLNSDFTDDSLWYSLGEHDKVTFVTEEGQRYRINTLFFTSGKLDGKFVKGSGLFVTPVDANGTPGDVVRIPKEDVLAGYHKALELKADGERAISDKLGDHGEFLLPLFVYFGVIDGDKGMFTTKRKVTDDKVCSCCGRKADRLFPVSTFDDLARLDDQLNTEREARWTDSECSTAAIFEAMGVTTPKAERDRQKQEKVERLNTSKAVQAFNADGGRLLCELCAQTIYFALEDGDRPHTMPYTSIDNLPTDVALANIKDMISTARDSYINLFGSTLTPDMFDNSSTFLFKAVDRQGTEHSFALTVTKNDHSDGDAGLRYRAMEIHRLTKAGRIATNNTGTDYDINHYKLVKAGENLSQKVLIGLIELMAKVRNVLMVSSLSELDSYASNLVTIKGKHYSIANRGQIVPIPVGCDDRFFYMSLRDREWPGDEYGFLIDGIIFSGQELATLCSSNEGAQIRFSCEDPSEKPLQNDEYLMPVRLSEKVLVDETIDLINMFAVDGRFEREKDRQNFRRLFTELLEKLKLYYESNGRGYGKLAGMGIIKQLEFVEGCEMEIDRVREIIRG